MKRSQAGFTLIELIIVIVILGILAVTAAPKFLNFGSDAKRSTLTGVKGALESASALVYGKAIIAGKQAAPSETLTIIESTPPTTVAIAYGYPDASPAVIRAIAELSAEEWEVLEATASGPAGSAEGDVVIAPKDQTIASLVASPCHVVFKAATAAGSKPEITVFGTGC